MNLVYREGTRLVLKTNIHFKTSIVKSIGELLMVENIVRDGSL